MFQGDQLPNFMSKDGNTSVKIPWLAGNLVGLHGNEDATNTPHEDIEGFQLKPILAWHWSLQSTKLL